MSFVLEFANRLNQFIRKNQLAILSFLLPVVILEIAYITRGIFPFGSLNVLLIDLYHQYAPFICELQDKLRSFSGLFYSWSGGLGTSFLPQFAYYLSSPLNFIIVLFPKNHLTEAILVLILLKVGLSGFCFNYYLKGVHGKENLIMVAFSLLYALSGYVLAYSWNIMWLDVIYLLPLVLLGLVRFIRDGRYMLYCVSLALLLLSNFYIAFFACIFILLYYPLCFFKYHGLQDKGLLLRKTFQFSGLSLLSAGLSAVLLLPTYSALKLTSAATDIFPKEVTHYFDLFDYISRHYVAASPTIREGLPNLYSGILVLILLPVYFLSRKIQLKEKLFHLVLLFFLLISFNINMLDFIWHGFHFPNQLPFRFSFVYIFLVLTMCYTGFTKLNEFKGKQLGLFCGIILLLIPLSQKLDTTPPGMTTIYCSIAFIVLYAIILTPWKSAKFGSRIKTLALFAIIIVEVSANTILTIGTISLTEGYTIRDGYASGTETEQIREQLNVIAENDNTFYRTEMFPPKTTNDPYLYNYNGLSIFSSTSPMKPVAMMEGLGYHSNGINSYKYEGSTLVLDSLFGIKYLFYRSTDTDERLYQEIYSTEELSVFKNPYAIPLGFYASPDIKNWESNMTNPFENQNRLMRKLSNVNDVFIPLAQKQGIHYNMSMNPLSTRYYRFNRTNPDTQSVAKVQILNDKDQQVYLYLDVTSNYIRDGFVMVGDRRVDFNASQSTLVNLGFCETDILIELELTFEENAPDSGSFQLYSYGLDLPEFEKAISSVQNTSLNIDFFSDTRIKGSIHAKTDGVMVMTIPYDIGWQVKVDNHKVQTEPIDDGLLSFEITEGFHHVELKFVPDKFYLGLLVSICSLLGFILIWLRTKKGRKTTRK